MGVCDNRREKSSLNVTVITTDNKFCVAGTLDHVTCGSNGAKKHKSCLPVCLEKNVSGCEGGEGNQATARLEWVARRWFVCWLLN